MIDGKIFLDEPIKNDMKTYDNIRKITNGQRDDFGTGCLLDYNYFKKDSMIATDLSKQPALYVDTNAIQQMNFTGILGGTDKRIIFFIIEEAKNYFRVFKRNCESIVSLFCLDIK